MQSKSKGKAVVHCRRVVVLASKDVPGRNIDSQKSLLPYTHLGCAVLPIGSAQTSWLQFATTIKGHTEYSVPRYTRPRANGLVDSSTAQHSTGLPGSVACTSDFQASHSTSPWSRPWLFTLRRSLSDWTLSANLHDSLASPFRSPLQILTTRSDDVCLTVRARAFRKKVGHLASIHTGPVHVCPRCLGRCQQHNDRAPETPCSSASRAVDPAVARQEQQSRPRMSPVPSATIQVVALMVGAGEDPEQTTQQQQQQ